MINKQNNDTSLLHVKLKLEPFKNILVAFQQRTLAISRTEIWKLVFVLLTILLAMRVAVDQA